MTDFLFFGWPIPKNFMIVAQTGQKIKKYICFLLFSSIESLLIPVYVSFVFSFHPHWVYFQSGLIRFLVQDPDLLLKQVKHT